MWGNIIFSWTQSYYSETANEEIFSQKVLYLYHSKGFVNFFYEVWSKQTWDIVWNEIYEQSPITLQQESENFQIWKILYIYHSEVLIKILWMKFGQSNLD